MTATQYWNQRRAEDRAREARGDRRYGGKRGVKGYATGCFLCGYTGPLQCGH